MSKKATDFDRQIMQRCLDLARLARGKTAPNPLVGSVIVKNGEIIGTGFHPAPGQPHAEIFALRAAGEEVRGATVYVNLEPCNHYGRTPPCSQALVKAGVAKVVVGMVDPDPRVSGAGIATLEAAGIKVVVGVEEAACQKLNEAFTHRLLYHKPFGILKYAMTLDGKIATATGHSSWVTSEGARGQVHELRAGCDGIIVGGNTVRRDNPHLTTHGVAEHNPLRIVMSRSLELPTQAHLWEQEEAATLVFTTKGTNPEVRQSLLAQGVEIVDLEPLTPALVMEELYERELMTVLWECGGILAAQAIATGSIQKVMAFIAPKIIGGADAPSPVASLGFREMTEAISLERVSYKSVPPDFLIEGYLPNS